MELIDQAKKIFLDPSLDESDYKENEAQINDWVKEISEHEAMASWQSHDVTIAILEKFNREYINLTFRLGTDKLLTDAARTDLFAKKEALAFMFSLMSTDAKSQLEFINKQIKQQISLFSG